MMLKSHRLNKCLLTLVLSVATLAVSAQKRFKYQAEIGRVDTTGFYAIALKPALVAKSNADLSDIRIVDDSGRFVPYVVYQGPDVSADNLAPYLAFPEVARKPARDTGNAFVVMNTSRAPVNNLLIRLKNAAVERSVNLYGSDDLEKWFVIKENIPLQQSASTSGSSYDQNLGFPSSNYHYFKLSVTGKSKAPVKFLEAGTLLAYPNPLSYTPITGTRFVKKDSAKLSIVTINLGDNYLVEKLKLQVKSPRFYNRNVEIYSIDGRKRTLLSTGVLRSDSDATPLIYAKTAKLELRIENEDNPPLDIQNITLYQGSQWLAAYLNAGKNYKILTGDTSAKTPVYDLKFFTDSVKGHLRHISPGPLTANTLYVAAVSPKGNGSNQTIIIWTAIIVALALLLALTWRMVGEMKKRETGHPQN